MEVNRRSVGRDHLNTDSKFPSLSNEEYEEVDLVLAYLPQHWEWVPILTGFWVINELIPEVLMVTGESRTMAAENGTEQRCP